MNRAKDLRPEIVSPECSEELKAKNQPTQIQRAKKLSELGKTFKELKSGLYRLERLPED